MPTQTEELLYRNAVKWIHEHPHDTRISEEIKQAFLSFNTLPQENKVQLLIALSKLLETARLPMEIEQWLLSDFDALPDELLLEIGSHLKNDSDMNNLVRVSKRMYSLFQPTRLLDKFLQRVAYGEQDKAEQLFTVVYLGKVEKIQEALLHQGRFTDYSGRTFKCSAYEYAYWAKDTHMCRMLERYMDDATKAEMLARVNKIEHTGLSYTQHGVAYCTPHFDFTPLIQALQFYVDNYDAWSVVKNWAALKAAWMEVGKAQRDVPAHVAQEYCHPDRAFDPLPSFNVDREDIPKDTLPRRLTFWSSSSPLTASRKSWYPLAASNSDHGFDFAVVRASGWRAGQWDDGAQAYQVGDGPPPYELPLAVSDLAAITRLDEVRTVELTQSREHLNPPPMSQSMSV
ncbi:F-box-like domain-containing protein [Legionella yabuuchiae]|uniref:F-box-like domain-containing protein n=1 Tax=Legionella yabuuchiae TaxID=376727 RepID=UPI00105562C6|nr:F-box-like domain-containing protein [Legionella yabuuchiae]